MSQARREVSDGLEVGSINRVLGLHENPAVPVAEPASFSSPVHPNQANSDHSAHRKGQVFGILALLCGLAYLVWLGRLVMDHREPSDFIFLATEALSFLLLSLLVSGTWPSKGQRQPAPETAHQPRVDLFIPCCREPFEIISTTLSVVRQISYQPLTVYVLDDGGSAAVAALADKLGYHYLSRAKEGAPLKDSKSGNLNFGLTHSDGELVMVLDADQVPDPEIVHRLVPYFNEPNVGYVQSKQAFFLPDGDPYYNSDKVFYDTLQLSNDRVNAVVSCGSGVIYRRRALNEVNGFATWNVVEDFTTSYELVSKQWRGIYYSRPLSRGLAPTTLNGVYRQRFQWALDAMRLFFWDNPLFKRGLTLRQRRQFLIIMLSYLASGLVFPVFYAIPLLVYWRGHSILLGDELSYWALRSAYFVATICMFRYLFLGKAPLRQFKMLCSLFPVNALAIIAALVYFPGRKPTYRVNNQEPFAESRSLWHLAPHLGFIALHLSLPIIALEQAWCQPRLICLNAVFSALIIWILGDLVLAVLSKPRWSPAMDPRQVYVAS